MKLEEKNYANHKIWNHLTAALQGGVSVGLENAGNLVIEPGTSFKIITTISLVAGTTFLMWLGEQITLRGVLQWYFFNYFFRYSGRNSKSSSFNF